MRDAALHDGKQSMDKANVLATAESAEQVGLWATAQGAAAVYGETAAAYSAGVHGENTNQTDAAGPGVKGVSRGTGVWGESATWHAVAGISRSVTGGAGVYGKSPGSGVLGESTQWHGVFGSSTSANGGAGVWGESKGQGSGVVGISKTWHAVFGKTASVAGGAGVAGENTGTGAGVMGKSTSGPAVYAVSATGEAVHGETSAPDLACIAAIHRNAESAQAAVYGEKAGTKGYAGLFAGKVKVVGDLEVSGDVTLPFADCAEFFDLTEGIHVDGAAGMVVVVGPDGRLRPCCQAYDVTVAGVVSGAGPYRPALLLDARNGSPQQRAPVALIGKVSVLVDAAHGAVRTGDLLTTSPTTGHAMRASDIDRRSGAVIGKALGSLESGRGLVPMLVSLQ